MECQEVREQHNMAIEYPKFASATGTTAGGTNDVNTAFVNDTGNILYAIVFWNTANTVTSVKYNTVALSLDKTQATGNTQLSIYKLASPATGSNTLQVVMNASGVAIAIGILSFANSNGSSTTASTTASSTTTISNSISATGANSFIIDAICNGTAVYSTSNPAAASGQIQQVSTTTSNFWYGASIKRVGASQNYTTQWNWNHVAAVASAMVQVEVLQTDGNHFVVNSLRPRPFAPGIAR